MRRWMWAPVLGLMCGCAEGTSDRPAYETGIDDPARAVDTLEEPQLAQVCESFDVYVNTYVSFDTIAYVACLPPSLVLSATRDECESRLAACLALFPEPIEVRARVRDQELCIEDLQQCSATVAELEGCANVNLDSVLQVDRWNCDLLGDAETVRMARETMDTVRVCAELDDGCNRFATVRGPQ